MENNNNLKDQKTKKVHSPVVDDLYLGLSVELVSQVMAHEAQTYLTVETFSEDVQYICRVHTPVAFNALLQLTEGREFPGGYIGLVAKQLQQKAPQVVINLLSGEEKKHAGKIYLPD